MSIDNIESISFNYLTNLTTINAYEVTTDVLIKTDPNITDEQFDQLYGLDTDQTIQEQIDEIQGEIAGIGSSYWGSFWSTSDQTNPTANTMNLFTFNNADPSNNLVDLSGSTPTSIVKIMNTNVFNIQFSAQLKHGNSSKIDVDIWLRKNGANVPATNSRISLDTNDQHVVPAWNFVLPFTSGDYIELAWSSSDTSVIAEYDPPATSPTRPAVPSIILTVTNVTGIGAQGIQGVPGEKSTVPGPRGPKGEKGDPGSGTVDDVARGLAGAALAESTIALAASASAVASVSSLSASVAIEQAVQNGRLDTLQQKTTGMIYTEDPSHPAQYEYSTTTFLPSVKVANGSGTGYACVLSSMSNNNFKRGIICDQNVEAGTSIYAATSITAGGDLSGGGNLTAQRAFLSRTSAGQKIIMYDGASSGSLYNYNGFSVYTPDSFNFSNLYNISAKEGFGNVYPEHVFTYCNSPGSTVKLATMSSQKFHYYTGIINLQNPSNLTSLRDAALIVNSKVISPSDPPLTEDDQGTVELRALELILGNVDSGNVKIIGSEVFIANNTTANTYIGNAGGCLTSIGNNLNCVINIGNGNFTKTTIGNSLSSEVYIGTADSSQIKIGGNGSGQTINIGYTSPAPVDAHNIQFGSTNSNTTINGNVNFTGNVNITGNISNTWTDLSLNGNLYLGGKIIPRNATNIFDVSAGEVFINSNSSASITANGDNSLFATGNGSIYIQPQGTGNVVFGTVAGDVAMDAYGNATFVARTGDLNFETDAGNITLDPAGANVNVNGKIRLLSGIYSTNLSSIFQIDNADDFIFNGTTETQLTLGFSSDATKTVTMGVDGTNAYIGSTGTNMDLTIGASRYLTFTNPLYVGYVYGDITSNKEIGWTQNTANPNTGTSYTGTASDTATASQVGTFTLPNAGVWLIQFDALFTLNTGSDTIQNKEIVLSETTASLTPCAPGFHYKDPIDDAAGSNGARQVFSFSGVYHATTGSKQLYINAIGQTSGTRTVTVSGDYKYTRIS